MPASSLASSPHRAKPLHHHYPAQLQKLFRMTQSRQHTHNPRNPPLRTEETTPSPGREQRIPSPADHSPTPGSPSPFSAPHHPGPLPPPRRVSSMPKCTCEACLTSNHRALRSGVMQQPSRAGVARVGDVCLNARRPRNVRLHAVFSMCVYDAASGEVLQSRSGRLDTSCERKPLGVLKTWGQGFRDSGDSRG